MAKEEPTDKSVSSGSESEYEEEEEDEKSGQCCCCHCGSGPGEDVRNQNYLKMREHLQQRLKAKSTMSSSDCDSTRSSSSKSAVDGYAEVDYLVEYIEGTQKSNPKNAVPNPKKAAKKARQKERKLLEKQKEAELAAKKAAEKLAAQSQPPPPAKDRVPNGMVRITHNPLTNSAVITPLYGPLEPNGLGPSYLQQSVGNIPKSGKMASTSSSQAEPPKKANQAPIPSKPPNPPVLQPASVSSSLANNSITNPSQPQQMVTIRRVMQPNLTEPMVTVTLKGETPDNDRVLFTLVNGQVLPTSGGPAQSQKQSNSIPKSGTTTAPTTVLSNRKQKKQEKKKQKKLLRATSNNEEFVELPQPPRELIRISPPIETHPAARDFSLDNFRLPPGITLTRVEGTHAPAHPDLPMRMVSRGKKDATYNTTISSNLPSANSIIVTSPQPHIAPKPKESMGSLGGLTAPNVIVVDTRKIQPSQQTTASNQQPRVVQTCSVAVQTGDDDDHMFYEASNPNDAKMSKKQRKKLKKMQQEEELLGQQLASMQLQNSKVKVNPISNKKTNISVTPVTNAKMLNGHVKSGSSQTQHTSTFSNSITTNGVGGAKTNGKKKKNRKKNSASGQSSEDKWEENVFVPKSDLDLEGGDLDEDERELEAFKRFCFNTVPPERKEKVRIHLNVKEIKDIFGKKSSNGLHNMTSCK